MTGPLLNKARPPGTSRRARNLHSHDDNPQRERRAGRNYTLALLSVQAPRTNGDPECPFAM